MIRNTAPLERAICGLAGLILVSGAMLPMLRGHLNYTNWLHAGFVFAPFAFVLGSIALLASVLNWERLWRRGGSYDGRKRKTHHGHSA